jgi:hypothetical protein
VSPDQAASNGSLAPSHKSVGENNPGIFDILLAVDGFVQLFLHKLKAWKITITDPRKWMEATDVLQVVSGQVVLRCEVGNVQGSIHLQCLIDLDGETLEVGAVNKLAQHDRAASFLGADKLLTPRLNVRQIHV